MIFVILAILLNPITTKRMNNQWGRVAPQALLYWTIAKDPCTVSSKLRNAYFKGKPVGPETALDLINLYSDIGFHYPAWKVGLKHAKFAPVYFYNFTREVKISFVDLFGYYKQTNPCKSYQRIRKIIENSILNYLKIFMYLNQFFNFTCH